jgi:putative spermidine/putrescine transport system ATP-binding protein
VATGAFTLSYDEFACTTLTVGPKKTLPLDPFPRTKAREELKRLQRELGITFIHVTHSQDEAMAPADLMEEMENGHIRQSDHPRDVLERPVSPFIARFIGGHNALRCDAGSIAVRVDRCWLGSAKDGPHVTGQVVAVEYQGAMVRVAAMTDAGDEVSALGPAQMFYRKPAEPGDQAAPV